MGLAYGEGVQHFAMATPPQNTGGAATAAPSLTATVDGTPVRLVVIALSAAAALTALRFAGFRFNVGVSS